MELRDRVVRLVREYYARHGRPPSVRYIARELRVSTKTLYKVFPRGIGEVYRAAGVEREELPESYREFLQLYREYLERSGLGDSAESLQLFITGVLEYVRSRLGRGAAERLAKKPLRVFNRVARLYLSYALPPPSPAPGAGGSVGGSG